MSSVAPLTPEQAEQESAASSVFVPRRGISASLQLRSDNDAGLFLRSLVVFQSIQVLKNSGGIQIDVEDILCVLVEKVSRRVRRVHFQDRVPQVPCDKPWMTA